MGRSAVGNIILWVALPITSVYFDTVANVFVGFIVVAFLLDKLLPICRQKVA